VAYPEPLERLIEAFERFPGVGRRTAARMAFHALRDARARELAPALERAVRETRLCRECCNVTAVDPCRLCADATRERGTICVVEQPRDVEALERAGVYRGAYHVLMGSLNPAEGTDEGDLAIERLLVRLRRGGVGELILATDPDAEGEATAALVLEAVERERLDTRVSRLARGLPAGSAIEYLHRGILEDALEGRRSLRLRESGAGPGTAPAQPAGDSGR
jgi:recombination protein RecR